MSDDDFLDFLIEGSDEFDGDDDFREVIVGNRDQCETARVVADLDGEWFKANPRYRYRVRRYVPGEFDSDSGGFVGDPGESIIVLVQRGGMKWLTPLGSFEDGRGWQAGGLL